MSRRAGSKKHSRSSRSDANARRASRARGAGRARRARSAGRRRSRRGRGGWLGARILDRIGGGLRAGARGLALGLSRWLQRARSRRFRRGLVRVAQQIWRAIPDALQWPVGLALLALAIVGANFAVQVARKPTELYFPIEDSLHKTHSETWRAYGHLFRRHSTAVLTSEFLAGLAQTEAAGNPVARTYWRFAWTGDPFSIYRPASSAVGMFQIIDGTFDEASRYCIHDHRVAEVGAWHDWNSCWFNGLYFRVIPSHAIELTAAHLQVHVEGALRRYPVPGASTSAKQELAALIHLCGAGAGRAHARRGLRLTPGTRCGSHSAYHYVSKVRQAQRRFEALSAAERRDR